MVSKGVCLRKDSVKITAKAALALQGVGNGYGIRKDELDTTESFECGNFQRRRVVKVISFFKESNLS